MSREIKFRAKSLLGLNPMIKGYYLFNEHSERHCIAWHPEHDNWQLYPIDPSTVGQFTGLHDKNGVEIYESDVVVHYIQSEFLDESDWDVIKGEVKMINGLWCVDQERYPLFAFKNEVLGNIHQKPELLK